MPIVQSVVWMRVEPGPQVGFETAGVVMGGAVVVARVVGVWTGVGLGRVDAETAAAAARRKAKILAVILLVVFGFLDQLD